jgi:hypothetical protein
MAEVRKRYSRKEKEEIAASQKCYVCDDLGLDHAGFEGYDLKDVQFDHYQTPFGNVGGAAQGFESDVLPIHSATGGSRPEDVDYETSRQRNCHSSRSNSFNSRASYVQDLRARMAARFASYVDDVYENAERKVTDRQYKLSAVWSKDTARFVGKDYPTVSEARNGEVWRRFLTDLPASKLFTDNTSQVREATKKTLHLMIDTFLIEHFPTFAPINARIDKCGHVVIFDGNHRATSHALAFGTKSPMPVMIWGIDPGDKCALREPVTGVQEPDGGASTADHSPSTTRLYEILVRLHDDVRQIQYPYSAKVLKWGIIRESEMEQARKGDPNASEKTIWLGEKPAVVAAKLAGAFTDFIDSEKYREKWMAAGLAEGSWKTFLELYCMLKADPAPFNSDEYLREYEMENLLTLIKILDEEVFGSPLMKGPTMLSASMKSKWWKECHKVFNEALSTAVYYKLQLPERPKNGACHTPEWTEDLKTEVRQIAKRWATCPLWDQPQSNSANDGGVDFTNNNEAKVKSFLNEGQFTTHYLEGR